MTVAAIVPEPPTPASMGAVLALDVGASRIKAALVTADGGRLAELVRPTERADGPAAVLLRVGDVAAELISAAGSAGSPLLADGIRAGGAAVCGTVDWAGRVSSVNLGWHGIDVGAAVSERLGFPVTVINDAHAGAIGEGAFGAAAGLRDFLYVALGTGIGAALVLNGRVVSGANGHAGELGHIEVERPGRPCACGAHGCLETVISAAAIETRWAQMHDSPQTAWQIIDRVIAGDPAASGIWSDALDALAASLLTTMSLIDPGTIVLGGGLSNAREHLLGPLARTMRSRVRSFQVPAQLRLAALGDWSGCAGAAVEAWTRLPSGAVS